MHQGGENLESHIVGLQFIGLAIGRRGAGARGALATSFAGSVGPDPRALEAICFGKNFHPSATTILLAMIAASGCGSDSDRVAQVALEASQRQAALDQEMARLNREVTEGTRQLIQSRGEADRQILAQQQDLQQQRQQLDDERRGIASQRLRESLLAPILTNLGWLAVGSLPLVCAGTCSTAWAGNRPKRQ